VNGLDLVPFRIGHVPETVRWGVVNSLVSR
jgi:hypothetical protein